MALRFRPNLDRLRPYSPGKPIAELRRESDVDPIFKLASNENPLGPSPKAIEAVERLARTMHIYPDASAHDLKGALARHFELPTSQIFLGNGSDECIRMLGWVLLESPDQEVVVGDPSFICYDETAHLAPARLVKIPLDRQMRHDLPRMAAAVTDRTQIVFIANPNNPTGTLVRKPEVDAFLGDVPEHVLVVLDEAYCEFAEREPDYPNGLSYVRERSNVCSLRTFSKSYGLAGIRCGYAFGPEPLVAAIERARQPFNVNALAQAAAIAALSDREHLEATLHACREGVDALTQLLRRHGLEPCESFANFVYVELGRPARPIFERLLQHGIIVRTGEPFGRPNALRISVGSPAALDALESALAAAMEVQLTS